jgi:triacylglycerol lipase
MLRARRRPATLIALAAALLLTAAALPAGASAQAAPFGTSAVVFVSGFTSTTPFSTPACPASGRGPTWGNAAGPPAAVAAAGLPVFTAPVGAKGGAAPASCLGGAYPDVPGNADTIDSDGGLAHNQAALVGFLTFLSTAYGITSVQLVGHSDGGLWSRAAITQFTTGTSPLTVTNLMTLGTPHTGAYSADLAEAVNADGGSCADLPAGVERDICDAFFATVSVVIGQLGKTATEELTSTWLEQWNPTTTIGCPVTTVAGDHVGFTLPGLGYYSPNDVLVGEDSALAKATPLLGISAPPFTPTYPSPDVFDVVHSPSFAFITPANLLDTAAISSAVVTAVQSPPSSPCVTAHTFVPPAAPAAARIAPSVPKPFSAPFVGREATAGGTVRRPAAGDAILLRPGASARCRGTALPATPLLGSKAVRVVIPRCSTRVSIRGRAMRIGLSTGHATLRITRTGGGTFAWRVRGGTLRDLRVQVRAGGRWRTVTGTSTTVRAASMPAIRVTGVDRSGLRVRAFAPLYVPA